MYDLHKRIVHVICLMEDDSSSKFPVCMACDDVEAPEPPSGMLSENHVDDIPSQELETNLLDHDILQSSVKECPEHGQETPSCEFCKRALGPLYHHLFTKNKYGTWIEDQTPCLSFDFSGPLPISVTGAQYMLLFVWRLGNHRLLWAYALDHRTKENIKSCLQDTMRN